MIRDLLIKDTGWKLFSLFLAITIWLTVKKINEEPVAVAGSTITFEALPVNMVSSASDVRAFQLSPRTVTVTFSGTPDVMDKLSPDQVRAMVDLTGVANLASGRELSRLVEISAPAGVTLVALDPTNVTITQP